jgi:hypothetical protein
MSSRPTMLPSCAAGGIRRPPNNLTSADGFRSGFLRSHTVTPGGGGVGPIGSTVTAQHRARAVRAP